MYARGKKAWGECARSGRRMLLNDMVADGYYPDLIVDPAWRDERHPQEHLPALRDATTLYRPAPQDLPAPTAPELEGEGESGGENEGVMYVLSTDDGSPFQVSEDGITFEPVALTRLGLRVTWVPNLQRWFSLGQEINISDDGIDWRETSVGVGSNVCDLAFAPLLGGNGQGMLVAVTQSGRIATSDDAGETWGEPSVYNNVLTLRGVAWDQELGLFAAIGSSGNPSTQRMQTSPDGDVWTARNFPSGDSTRAIASNSLGRFLTAHPLSGISALRTSTDGITWSGASITPRTNAATIAFGLGLFGLDGLSGGNNYFQSSADGLGGWASTIVGANATLGNSFEVKCDPTRNQWWYVSANRLHRSDNAAGTAWTQALAGTRFRSIGVRDLIV